MSCTKIYDINNVFGRPNNSSIGVLEIDPDAPPPPDDHWTNTDQSFKSIYADDVIYEPEFETEVTTSTGIHIQDGLNPLDFIIADGWLKRTISTRVHFNFANGIENFNCSDFGEAKPHPTCDENNVIGPEIVMKSLDIKTKIANVDYVTQFSWHCNDYKTPPALRKKSNLNSLASSEVKISRIDQNTYQIFGVKEKIDGYQLFDLSGRTIPIDINDNIINLDGLSPGIYIFKFAESDKFHTKKLIAQ